MKLIQYNNARTLLFISGMFAGDWIWKQAHTKIDNSHHLLIKEPLCSLGNKVSTLADQIMRDVGDWPTRLTLVGNSLGSLVAMDIARKNPDKVDTLLISGAAGFGEINLDIRLRQHNTPEFQKKLSQLICYDSSLISSEDSQKALVCFQTNLRNIIGLIRESNEAKASEILPEIKCPIHGLWGGNDLITPFLQASSILKQYNIPITILKNCGHSPMYEKPEAFAQWVNHCLD